MQIYSLQANIFEKLQDLDRHIENFNNIDNLILIKKKAIPINNIKKSITFLNEITNSTKNNSNVFDEMKKNLDLLNEVASQDEESIEIYQGNFRAFDNFSSQGRFFLSKFKVTIKTIIKEAGQTLDEFSIILDLISAHWTMYLKSKGQGFFSTNPAIFYLTENAFYKEYFRLLHQILSYPQSHPSFERLILFALSIPAEEFDINLDEKFDNHFNNLSLIALNQASIDNDLSINLEESKTWITKNKETLNKIIRRNGFCLAGQNLLDWESIFRNIQQLDELIKILIKHFNKNVPKELNDLNQEITYFFDGKLIEEKNQLINNPSTEDYLNEENFQSTENEESQKDQNESQKTEEKKQFSAENPANIISFNQSIELDNLSANTPSENLTQDLINDDLSGDPFNTTIDAQITTQSTLNLQTNQADPVDLKTTQSVINQSEISIPQDQPKDSLPSSFQINETNSTIDAPENANEEYLDNLGSIIDERILENSTDISTTTKSTFNLNSKPAVKDDFTTALSEASQNNIPSLQQESFNEKLDYLTTEFENPTSLPQVAERTNTNYQLNDEFKINDFNYQENGEEVSQKKAQLPAKKLMINSPDTSQKESLISAPQSIEEIKIETTQTQEKEVSSASTSTDHILENDQAEDEQYLDDNFNEEAVLTEETVFTPENIDMNIKPGSTNTPSLNPTIPVNQPQLLEDTPHTTEKNESLQISTTKDKSQIPTVSTTINNQATSEKNIETKKNPENASLTPDLNSTKNLITPATSSLEKVDLEKTKLTSEMKPQSSTNALQLQNTTSPVGENLKTNQSSTISTTIDGSKIPQATTSAATQSPSLKSDLNPPANPVVPQANQKEAEKTKSSQAKIEEALPQPLNNKELTTKSQTIPQKEDEKKNKLKDSFVKFKNALANVGKKPENKQPSGGSDSKTIQAPEYSNDKKENDDGKSKKNPNDKDSSTNEAQQTINDKNKAIDEKKDQNTNGAGNPTSNELKQDIATNQQANPSLHNNQNNNDQSKETKQKPLEKIKDKLQDLQTKLKDKIKRDDKVEEKKDQNTSSESILNSASQNNPTNTSTIEVVATASNPQTSIVTSNTNTTDAQKNNAQSPGKQSTEESKKPSSSEKFKNKFKSLKDQFEKKFERKKDVDIDSNIKVSLSQPLQQNNLSADSFKLRLWNLWQAFGFF